MKILDVLAMEMSVTMAPITLRTRQAIVVLIPKPYDTKGVNVMQSLRSRVTENGRR